MSLVAPSLVESELESAQCHSELNSKELNSSMGLVAPSQVGSEFAPAQRQ